MLALEVVIEGALSLRTNVQLRAKLCEACAHPLFCQTLWQGSGFLGDFQQLLFDHQQFGLQLPHALQKRGILRRVLGRLKDSVVLRQRRLEVIVTPLARRAPLLGFGQFRLHLLGEPLQMLQQKPGRRDQLMNPLPDLGVKLVRVQKGGIALFRSAAMASVAEVVGSWRAVAPLADHPAIALRAPQDARQREDSLLRR